MSMRTGWGVLGVLTLVGLLYVHQQTVLVRQSYRLNERLAVRDVVYEHYVYLDYDVMTRKAPNRLREQLATYDIQLAVPETTRVVTAQ
jgi:hypothetical protein